MNAARAGVLVQAVIDALFDAVRGEDAMVREARWQAAQIPITSLHLFAMIACPATDGWMPSQSQNSGGADFDASSKSDWNGTKWTRNWMVS